MFRREDAIHELLRVVWVKHAEAFEPLELAANANDGRRTTGQMQVGRVLRDHILEKIIERVRRTDRVLVVLGGRRGAHGLFLAHHRHARRQA